MTMGDATTFPVLSLLLGLPLLGTGFCLLFRRNADECRWASLATTLAVLVVSVWCFLQSPGPDGWYLVEDYRWIPWLGARFTLAMDGISLLMVLLTAFLQVIAVLISWHQKKHPALLFSLLLLLEAGLLGVFLATDLLLFYLFWEMMLIPMFFLIGVWGHGRRVYAAVKFFLFTLAGSLLMLVAIIGLYLLHGRQTGDYTFALEALKATNCGALEPWLYAGFMIGFLVKVPVVPLHTWLPDAHTVAPGAGSLDLAGLLLKTGVFGILRFAFPLFPASAAASLPALAVLALVGLFYAAWCAYLQEDVKRLIAYSSISHLGVILLGLAAGSRLALEGAILLMACHGLTTGALFALVSMLRRRTGTRELAKLGGLWKEAPIFSWFFLYFSLASLGLPGLANFSGEILVFAGTFQTRPLWGALAVLGVVFAAAYMLRMVQGVLWGKRPPGRPWVDLTWREGLTLAALAFFTLWLGVQPGTFIEPLHLPVQTLLEGTRLLAAAGGAP
ncbi:NADH dehydrogenase subunit M [Desulfuromonas versatilis]|uniref:NADH dehydrogenase subunit M n=1 Tax=Desulfuromonas versatilis TaxID=2802975 RepID=A0ABN6DT93_9BACT|nr:NADH-quinone oxidoreductase subunit M [Desulfuromonas versatilis]BCR03378.1 NADH dehydrogenase subunit M [Desulfuromonas versatilis]